MDTSLADIRYFLEVSRALNISRAAERLALRQSSLSMAIKRLEDALGMELLIRSRTGVRLTKAGQLFASASHELIEKWESLRFATQGANQEIAGTYTLGCHSIPSRYVLPMFLPELHRKHPRLQVQLVHDRSHILCERVISATLDFAIVAVVVPHPDLVTIRLGEDITGIWAHPDVKIDPKQTVLMLDPNVRQAQELLRVLERKKIRFEHTLTSSSIETLWALAEAGHGAVVMPNNPVHYARGRVPLKLAEHLPMVNGALTLVYRADTQRSAAAKEIVRTIKEHCFADLRK